MADGERMIYLIGGAPAVGKSTGAESIAGRLRVPWISTDQIRDIMRTTADRHRFSELFSPSGYSAEGYCAEFSTRRLIEMEIAQSEAAWPGIRRFIRDDYTWTKGFVVEGVNILPRSVARDFGGDPSVRVVFLAASDKRQIRDVVHTRGMWAAPDSYPDAVKDREVIWAWSLSQMIEAEARELRYPVVHMRRRSDDVELVARALDL